MEIRNFLLHAPDEDGEIFTDTSMVFAVTNPTREVVRWVRSFLTYVDKGGFPLACRELPEDCELSPGGEVEISPVFSDSMLAQVAGTDCKNVKLIVSATLYARDHFQLGDFEVPADDHGLVAIEHDVSSSLIESPVKGMIVRTKPDSSGLANVNYHFFVQNVSDLHLGRVEVTWDLVDRDGAVSSSSWKTLALPARTAACIHGGIGWMKKSQLKGRLLRVSLSVYRPVHSAEFSCQARPA